MKGEVVLGSRILESLHEGCQVIELDYRYLYVNESFAKQGQRSKEQLVGKMMECYPGIERTEMFDIGMHKDTQASNWQPCLASSSRAAVTSGSTASPVLVRSSM